MNQFLHKVWMLALMAWREARGESDEGVVAVMCTVRERVNNAAKWEGTDYVDCITRAWQYSSISDPNDRQLTYFPKLGDARFFSFIDLAVAVIENRIPHPAPRADSYFDDSIKPPNWATPDKFIKKIGRLNFYKVL